MANVTKIELYDNFVKFPNDEDLKKMDRIAHLVYITPYAGSIIEYAGRTCYKSFNAITTESHKKFINTVTSLGHESVIEHSNLVYVIFKKNNKKLSADSDNINRHLVTVMMYCGLLKVSENQGYYLISGNLRMFKDLVREFLRIREKSNKSNPIIEDIMKSFYRLPEYMFADLIKNGWMDRKKFKPDPRYIDSKPTLEFKCLNNYVSVVNHDNFSFRVRGFVVNDHDNQSVVRRLTTPTSVLKKHNRLTLIINAPRYITHQIVRHRIASYSQASQRYIKEEGMNVYIPETFKVANVESMANNFFKTSMLTYNSLIEEGVPKEDARAVLTNACMSTIVMTATIEEFYHFIKWRADKAAQNFIRDMIAVPIKEYIEDYYRKSEDGEEAPPPYKANRIVVPETTEKKGKGRKLSKKITKRQTQSKKQNAPKKQQQKENKPKVVAPKQNVSQKPATKPQGQKSEKPRRKSNNGVSTIPNSNFGSNSKPSHHKKNNNRFNWK